MKKKNNDGQKARASKNKKAIHNEEISRIYGNHEIDKQEGSDNGERLNNIANIWKQWIKSRIDTAAQVR